jgi:membrane protein required for colicin V production
MILDLVIIGFMLAGGVYGIICGGVRQILSILGLVVGLLAAVFTTGPVSQALGFGENSLAKVIIFIIIFASVNIGIVFLGRLLKKILHLMLLGLFDRLLGLAIGVVKGYIAVFIISLLVSVLAPKYFLSSRLGPIILDSAKVIIGELIRN